MTGIPNVNNILSGYQLITLIVLAGIAIYDAKHHLILNSVLLPFLLWSFVSIPVRHMCGSCSYLQLLLSSVGGFVCGGFLLLLAALLTKDGVGGGDIKLTAILGIIYGAADTLELVITASILAAICMILYRFKKVPTLSLPFGPFLFAGCMLQLLY